jgi:hypothetical protein
LYLIGLCLHTSEVLVLTTNSLKLFLSLIVSSLKTEEFSGIVAALLLGGIKFSSQIINLKLPFTNDLVEVLLFLFSSVGNLLGAVNLQRKVLNLGGEALAGLFKSNTLLVQGLDGFLSLCKTGLQLAPVYDRKMLHI